MRILLVNGPNLGRLGSRDPDVYGRVTLPEVVARCRDRAAADGASLDDLQSNHEGVVIDRLERRDFDALVVNPGAWCHYSYALLDALAALDVPIAEIHISDVYAREPFRHVDLYEDLAAFRVVGHGVAGYVECVEWVLAHAPA